MSQWARISSRRRATAHADRFALAPEPPHALRPSTVYRFVMGVDSEPAVMAAADLARLGDPLAAVLRSGRFPLTVHELLAALDGMPGVERQRSYLVGEAGQIPPDSAPGLTRDLRFAVTRGDSSHTNLLISTDARDEKGFLQVAGWDEAAGLFNYYMRLDGAWVWSGNSYSALEPGSRGNGCFDSHVNGSLVMKELKAPWMNWQSMKATILLAPDDPLRAHPLYPPSGAENLEMTVRAGVERWTTARLARAVSGGTVANAGWLLRQLCTTTTVNLASTDVASAAALADPALPLTLPLGFWLNADALLDVLGIPADFAPPRVPGPLYADRLRHYEFALQEGTYRRPGDTFFAFVVPEASVEDNEVVRQLVASGLVTDHFAASVLMVDFPNPVFSPDRAKLLSYVPATAAVDPAAGGLSGQIAGAIVAAAAGLPATSPEARFAAGWRLDESEWRPAFAAAIQVYMAAVGALIGTVAGYDAYVRLAESRRREFRGMRLNEFALSLPVTSIPPDAPLLRMDETGAVGPQ
jgi:hypothetical protein